MTAILALVTSVFEWLLVDMDGVGVVYTNGALIEFAQAIIGDPLLMLPVVLLLVGLPIGIFTRTTNSVR